MTLGNLGVDDENENDCVVARKSAKIFWNTYLIFAKNILLEIEQLSHFARKYL